MGNLQITRLAAPTLDHRLTRVPVVVLVGARQTGKSTLVRLVASPRRYETLDALATLDRARAEPESLVATLDPLTIDEVQRAPNLLLAIKQEVDNDRRPGRFLLTGSANLLLMAKVGESLAGRATYLHLRPLTEREKHQGSMTPLWAAFMAAKSIQEAMQATKGSTASPDVAGKWRWTTGALQGGLPPAALAADSADRSLWFDGYVDTYLQRDLRDLAQIGDLPGFLRFTKVVALRTGGLLNQTDLARDAAIPRATAQRWLSLLELSFLATLVPAFAVSKTKRLIKAPKVYFGDSGLGLHLAGVYDEASLKSEMNAGAHLEALVLNDLLCWRELVSPKPEVFHYRSAGGEEIDFIVEQGRRLLPIEVKSRGAPRTSDARAIDAFCEERKLPFGLLLYDGSEVLALTKYTIAVPLSLALGVT